MSVFPVHREPYVGDGVDGMLRSQQIDLSEADQFPPGHPMHLHAISSARDWERRILHGCGCERCSP